MGNIVVLFAGFDMDAASNNFCLEKSFAGKSAVDLALAWASSNGERTFVLSLPKNAAALSALSPGVDVIEDDSWTASKIASSIASCCEKSGCGTALYAWIDLPFLNGGLTERLLALHRDCASEYTFADGFPYGIAPEVVDSGTASIIAHLASEKDFPAARMALFDTMRAEINSFEVETIVSDFDYRPLRISLEASSKGSFLSCRSLFDSLGASAPSSVDADELCRSASENPSVIRNIPHFFDMQITSKTRHRPLYAPENAGIGVEKLPDMSVEDFRRVVDKICAINPDAVVSLSAFGEPSMNPDFVAFVEALSERGLRILIETDGLSIDESLVGKIAGILSSSSSKIDWIVDLDAADASFYAKVRHAPEADFERAVASVGLLSASFKGHVYPQMTRMKANEENLEKFFRYWKNPESPSGGKLIVKKYDSLCGKLPDEKPADLSPLNRIPCWHLARDFVILSDGSVPKCRSCGNSSILGNAFTDSLDDIWACASPFYVGQVRGEYCGNCGECDEYYTFSF